MGIYVFKKSVLVDLLKKKYPGSNDFGGEIIPMAAAEGQKVIAYLFNDYWEDIGTIKSFFDANLALAQTVRTAPLRAACSDCVSQLCTCMIRKFALSIHVRSFVTLTHQGYGYCFATHAHQQTLSACTFKTHAFKVPGTYARLCNGSLVSTG